MKNIKSLLTIINETWFKKIILLWTKKRQVLYCRDLVCSRANSLKTTPALLQSVAFFATLSLFFLFLLSLRLYAEYIWIIRSRCARGKCARLAYKYGVDDFWHLTLSLEGLNTLLWRIWRWRRMMMMMMLMWRGGRDDTQQPTDRIGFWWSGRVDLRDAKEERAAIRYTAENEVAWFWLEIKRKRGKVGVCE